MPIRLRENLWRHSLSTKRLKVKEMEVNQDFFNYQLYQNYAVWSTYNQSVYSTIPAYQELRSPKLLNGFTIDLTKEAPEKPKTDTPTQAKDFKLLCAGCKRNFTSKKRLENHFVKCKVTKKAAQDKFSCKKCSKTFKKRYGLYKHSMKYHDETESDMETLQKIDVPEEKRSIFHSIQLLAESDCK